MTSTFNGEQDDVSIDVYVSSAMGTEIASKIIGYFVIKGERTFRFRAIAFGRIGGHNISLSISKKTIEAIKKMRMDPEGVALKVQRKLIEGDISIVDSNKKIIKSN
jgi:hypothetical protein